VGEDVGWCVWYANTISSTTSSVGDWQSVSTWGGDAFQRHQRAKREKSGWSLAWGRGTLGESASTAAHQKGTILEVEIGQDGTDRHRIQGASSGVLICNLSEGPAQASHRHEEYLCTGEVTISRCADTKKMYIPPWKYTIIRDAMSRRLVEGGLARVAGQSCLAGPSVAPTVPMLRASPCMGVW
jgi:hypothetical protein